MKKKTSLLNITLSMIKCGLRTRLWTIPAVFASLYIVLWFLRGAALPDGIGNTLSAGVFMLFRGDMPYMIGSGGDFKLPIVWLSANAFIAFTLRTFPIEISMLHEHKTMLGSVSKNRWWTAKFITMWVLVSFEFVLIYTAAILFSGINSNSLAPGEYFFRDTSCAMAYIAGYVIGTNPAELSDKADYKPCGCNRVSDSFGILLQPHYDW